jgi:hypothetical protein
VHKNSSAFSTLAQYSLSRIFSESKKREPNNLSTLEKGGKAMAIISEDFDSHKKWHYSGFS